MVSGELVTKYMLRYSVTSCQEVRENSSPTSGKRGGKWAKAVSPLSQSAPSAGGPRPQQSTALWPAHELDLGLSPLAHPLSGLVKRRGQRRHPQNWGTRRVSLKHAELSLQKHPTLRGTGRHTHVHH